MVSTNNVWRKYSDQIYKPFNRNHPTLCFWLRREGRQMPNTKQLLYQTDKKSHRRYSIKSAVLRDFAIFTKKYLCWSLFIIKRLQHRCFTVNIAKFLRIPILNKICVRLLLNWLYEVIVWGFVSGQSLSKPSWLSNITKIPAAFKSEL